MIGKPLGSFLYFPFENDIMKAFRPKNIIHTDDIFAYSFTASHA